jgi:hypothetical protein
MTSPDQSRSSGRFTAGLTPRQTLTLLTCGAVLWLAAALLLGVLGPMGAYNGVGRIVLYGLIIPGTAPFVWALGRLAMLRSDQIATGMAMALTPAVLLDGVALAWIPEIYGSSASLQAGAGGAILWGAGVLLALGFLFNRP